MGHSTVRRRRLHNHCPARKPGFKRPGITTSIRAALSDFEALRLLLRSARHQRERAPGTGPMLVPSLPRYQACSLSKPGIDLCTPDFRSRSVRYQSISHRTDRTAFRVPIELRDRIRNQPVLRDEDQIVGVHSLLESAFSLRGIEDHKLHAFPAIIRRLRTHNADGLFELSVANPQLSIQSDVAGQLREKIIRRVNQIALAAP